MTGYNVDFGYVWYSPVAQLGPGIDSCQETASFRCSDNVVKRGKYVGFGASEVARWLHFQLACSVT